MNKVAIISLVLIQFQSCKNKPIESPTKVCEQPSTITFTKDILPILNTECSTNGCHNSVSKAGNLDLSEKVAYDNLLKKSKGYVELSNPEISILYTQMRSQNSPMPPKGLLDNCTTDKILVWIKNGAKKE